MSETMRAAVLDLDTHILEITDVPVPHPGSGEVRVKVKAAGVCLSDVHLANGQLRPTFRKGGPVILGHEIAGVVDLVGPDVEDAWQAGDRVTLYPIIDKADGPRTQGVDYAGGWAEYIVVPAANLISLPDSVPFDQGAILPDAVSTPWGAIVTTAGTVAGQSAGVWGLGGLGIHAVQILRAIGAAPIIAMDPLPAARERALKVGADIALDSTAPDFIEQFKAATGGRGIEQAFDFAGVRAVQEQALAVLGAGGQLTMVGLSGQPFTVASPQKMIVYKQRINGHFGSVIDEQKSLVRLAALGRLDFSGSISLTLPLEQAAEAIRRLEHKEGDPIRIILNPELNA